MRQLIPCNSPDTARAICPWAKIIVRACGGFLAFADVADFWAWRAL